MGSSPSPHRPESALAAWFAQGVAYELEVCLRVLASFDTVPADARGAPDYRRALDLYDHVLAARDLWLRRVRGERDREEDWFPEGAPLEELARRTEEVFAAWTSYTADLTSDEIARPFRYTSWGGGRYENTIEDVLTQLFGHSFYHRGQIASLVRSLGGTPARTDYLPTRRRPVDGEDV